MDKCLKKKKTTTDTDCNKKKILIFTLSIKENKIPQRNVDTQMASLASTKMPVL